LKADLLGQPACLCLVRLYNEQLFQTPAIMVRPDITRKFNPSGIADAVLASQTGILSGLLQDSRLKRMSEQEALTPKSAYTVANLFDDLEAGFKAVVFTTKFRHWVFASYLNNSPGGEQAAIIDAVFKRLMALGSNVVDQCIFPSRYSHR
jgi:hypothetical protein